MSPSRRSISRTAVFAALTVCILGVAVPAPAQIPQLEAPWNGEPISAGLGPTYDDPWCAEAAPGSSIANQQSDPLALIPQEAVGCTLDKIAAEAQAAGIPDRMDHFVIGKSAGGRDLYGVVVNALETAEQQRDFERWQNIRAIELTDPEAAQDLLASYGADVKMPIFVQGNIHGDEEEGADAMMQVIRDLVTLPRGTDAVVDDILDHAILIVVPMANPDGRLAGERENGNWFDMNRDWLVQSQSEVRASAELQQEWLAPVGFDMHGYVSPTLIDALTKPHNPGIEYDTFLYWNQRRIDANEADLAALGMPVTRPANHYNPLGLPPGHPHIAEGWDDWGPFYTQTYMAFYGVDSSTVEMCSGPVGLGGMGAGVCNGRLGSKTAQYVTFYSSADYWLANRQAMINAQLENFARGVNDESRVECCADPYITGRGFTADQHDWMVEYPTAYVIPFGGGGQRSDAEANRMVQWLLDNGIQVTRTTADFTWGASTFPAGSYVVWMDQALRGLALTALSAGQDISARITQLYASPAAWSHGLLWGADVLEVPRGDATFTPDTVAVEMPNALQGGIRGGVDAPADFYSVALQGVSEYRVLWDLLDGGVTGEVAEAPFESTTGGEAPAGSLIFPNDPETAIALDAAGAVAGVHFERNVGVSKPPTTQLAEAPKVAILVNSSNPQRSHSSESMRAIFDTNAGFVSVTAGPDSLQNADVDPLEGYDVIYNLGQSWPSNQRARERLTAFFDRGGGYLATSVSTSNFSFLAGAGLISGTLTQGSQTAEGGIAVWRNDGVEASPITGSLPSEDFLFLPGSVTYFTATPQGAVIDGRYHPDMVGAGPNGPSDGYVAGLWRTRMAAANSAPVMLRGSTTLDSRYFALSSNPFDRQDAERMWALIAQAALWSNLTDEGNVGQTISIASRELMPFYPTGKRMGEPPMEVATQIAIPGTRSADR